MELKVIARIPLDVELNLSVILTFHFFLLFRDFDKPSVSNKMAALKNTGRYN